jgi:hypothetical protein
VFLPQLLLAYPKVSASLRVVRGEAIRCSSSKSEIESAETPLLVESCRTVTPRSLRTLFRLCSSGMDRRQAGLCPDLSFSVCARAHIPHTGACFCAAARPDRPWNFLGPPTTPAAFAASQIRVVGGGPMLMVVCGVDPLPGRCARGVRVRLQVSGPDQILHAAGELVRVTVHTQTVRCSLRIHDTTRRGVP